MGKKKDVAGFNTRYGDTRNRGFSGAKTANITPREDQVSWNAADPAGTYDSAAQVAGTQVSQVSIQVTQVFDGGATLIVGVVGDTDRFVDLADAVDLTQLGVTVVPVPSGSQVIAIAGVIRATIGGAPTQGAAVLTAQVQI